MAQFLSDAIFWVETEKIKPNPFQPRREFDEARLRDLADSIRMYGILQPLVVTRKEVTLENGGLAVEYELISGERRLRASKISGLAQVPVIIRRGEESDREKLELAIIENLQREDLNVVDRARAFKRLVEEFGFKHHEVGKKVGKSREYVSNSMRVLDLSEEILEALTAGKITEGHTRPLLMLTDRPEEQTTLFKEIMYKRITVREAEGLARHIAVDRARKREVVVDPIIAEFEAKLRDSLGTRVKIEKTENGGKIHIDFFSSEDLRTILALMESNQRKSPSDMLDRHIIEGIKAPQSGVDPTPVPASPSVAPAVVIEETIVSIAPASVPDAVAVLKVIAPVDDLSKEEKQVAENEEIYSVRNFSV